MGDSNRESIPTYGFIGLGVMGYGMAVNLRKKIPRESNLVVCELVEGRRSQFVEELGKEYKVSVADSPVKIAEMCVSNFSSPLCWFQ